LQFANSGADTELRAIVARGETLEGAVKRTPFYIIETLA
jgi:hypothetical protein